MERLYCAIDTADFETATRLTASLGGVVGGVKLGSAFVLTNGMRGVAAVARADMRVMLDLKLLEIPRDVATVVRAAAASDAFLLTIHTLGGAEMMRTAMAAALRAADAGGGERLKILGVTLLTSMGDDDVERLGMGPAASDQVRRLAGLAQECGLDGVWTSAHDLETLRRDCGNDFLLVVPGIRPVWSHSDDQRRIITPGDAILNGADYLVVGRPITQADDPAAAARRVADEMAAVAA